MQRFAPGIEMFLFLFPTFLFPTRGRPVILAPNSRWKLRAVFHKGHGPVQRIKQGGNAQLGGFCKSLFEFAQMGTVN